MKTCEVEAVTEFHCLWRTTWPLYNTDSVHLLMVNRKLEPMFEPGLYKLNEELNTYHPLTTQMHPRSLV